MFEFLVLSGLSSYDATQASEFSTLVSSYLAEGWELVGPLATTYLEDEMMVQYSQAVVKRL